MDWQGLIGAAVIILPEIVVGAWGLLKLKYTPNDKIYAWGHKQGVKHNLWAQKKFGSEHTEGYEKALRPSLKSLAMGYFDGWKETNGD